MNESCLIPKGTATHDNLCFYSDTGMYNSGNDGGTHDIFPMMIISTLWNRQMGNVTSGLSQAGGTGGALAAQFLADQLTLSQPGGPHYPHPVLCAPPRFSDLATALDLN